MGYMARGDDQVDEVEKKINSARGFYGSRGKRF